MTTTTCSFWVHQEYHGGEGIDECSTRLALCQKLLTGLGETEPDTGIGIVLSRHRQLTAVMLDKVHTAQDIINTVTESQEHLRSQTLNAVLNDAAAGYPNDDRNGIWSTLGHGSYIYSQRRETLE